MVAGRTKLFIFVGALSLLTISFILFGSNGLAKYKRMRSELEQIKSENANLVAENERLRNEAEKLRNDIEFIERQSRQKLGLVKKDEIMVRFHQPKTEPDIAEQEEESVE